MRMQAVVRTMEHAFGILFPLPLRYDPHMGGFPKIMGTVLGVPRIMSIVFLGSRLGTPV